MPTTLHLFVLDFKLLFDLQMAVCDLEPTSPWIQSQFIQFMSKARPECTATLRLSDRNTAGRGLKQPPRQPCTRAMLEGKHREVQGATKCHLVLHVLHFPPLTILHARSVTLKAGNQATNFSSEKTIVGAFREFWSTLGATVGTQTNDSRNVRSNS